MTGADYLARVAAHLSDEDSWLLDVVTCCLPSSKGMESLTEMLEGFLFDPSEGHAGLLEVHPLDEVHDALSRPGFKVHNWHYDRMAEVLLVNLKRGVHEGLSAALTHVYLPATRSLSQELAAERFISAGLGWFRSTSSCGRALKNPDVILSQRERDAFRSVTFQDV